jgi:2-hydroxychromene-2-carboxylate isomerase
VSNARRTLAMDFFYDLGSPYAWLTAERVPPGTTWIPVLLGGIFRATGRSSWAETPARGEGIEEIERRARDRGLPPPAWPEPWPNNGLTAMRAAVAAHRLGEGERFALTAFRTHFVDGLALSEPEHVALAADRAGLDGEALLAATQEQPVKDQLRENTEEAVAAGVFGIPSARLESGEIVWGDDRIP